MSKERPRHAWVIEWTWIRDDRKVKTKLLHVLNPRINHGSVLKYLKCLYLNSDMTVGADRLRFLSSKYWKGMEGFNWPQVYVGHDPWLMAWHVNDLTVAVDYKHSREVFRWTQAPRGSKPIRREESLPLG